MTREEAEKELYENYSNNGIYNRMSPEKYWRTIAVDQYKARREAEAERDEAKRQLGVAQDAVSLYFGRSVDFEARWHELKAALADSQAQVERLKEEIEKLTAGMIVERVAERGLLGEHIEAVAAQARGMAFEEVTAICEALRKPAHTYASENADHYRGFDLGVKRVWEAVQARAQQKNPEAK